MGHSTTNFHRSKSDTALEKNTGANLLRRQREACDSRSDCDASTVRYANTGGGAETPTNAIAIPVNNTESNDVFKELEMLFKRNTPPNSNAGDSFTCSYENMFF